MHFNIRTISLLVVVALLATATLIRAEDIKQRMLSRLPELQALKEKGIIGEGKNGFLQFRKQAPDKKALVDAENADRTEVYRAIAAQQGVSPEVVGQRRALQIAERAEPGVWLQKQDGTWYQK